jgi:hypothetical protein
MFTVRYCANVPAHTVTSRIIRNPNYGGPGTIVPGTCMIPIRERKIKPQFFKALRKDVAKNGFRNPILLYSTPDGLLLSFGGSRLRVAKEMSMMVPAIIVDYDGSYFHCDQVTIDNYGEYFEDVPVLFEFTKYGVDTHYSLERNRRDAYDAAGMAWTESVEDTTFLDEEFPWLSDE